MILLTQTTHSLVVTTSVAGSVDYVISYVDVTSTDFTPGSNDGNITTATSTTIAAAPAASTQRQIKQLIIKNVGTVTQVVEVKKDISGTTRAISPTASLQADESLNYSDTKGWYVLTADGRQKAQDAVDDGVSGFTAGFYKVGTAPEAAGQWYCWSKDSGAPGAWAPGTPGLNGRATDGTTTADAGCIFINNPVSGSNYLTSFQAAPSVICHLYLFDVMWVNTGLVVTTTTAQAITPVALPARDQNGSTDGVGVWAGLLVTTATTNGSAVTTITMSYTNEHGVSGRTATMASFPATATIGTVVWFQLQAGDHGVRSVQSVTLGTSLVTGAVSLILARPLISQPALVANVGGFSTPPMNPGVRLYNGTCALLFGLMSATTATGVSGTFQVMVR